MKREDKAFGEKETFQSTYAGFLFSLQKTNKQNVSGYK